MFSMSDLGLLSYYLDIEVEQTTRTISLCQVGSAGKMLMLSGMADCNSCQTPMENCLKLTKKSGGYPVNDIEYRSIIGS